MFSWFWTAQDLRSFSEENIVYILENVVKIMHKRFKKLKRRSRRLRNRFGLYELLRTLLSKMGLETPFERKFKDYLFIRYQDRWLNKIIYKTEMKFWAVLGRQGGCREKKTPDCHKYATFWGAFSIFCGQKNFLNFYKNIFASALKSYII